MRELYKIIDGTVREALRQKTADKVKSILRTAEDTIVYSAKLHQISFNDICDLCFCIDDSRHSSLDFEYIASHVG